MAGSVLYKASVEKDLRRIDRQTASRLLSQLERALSENPRTGEPLSGEFRGLFKYRTGDYRVIYSQIPDGVLVLRIGHRKEVYRP